MGLFDGILNEFIEVIEYIQDDKDVLVYKYPITSKQQIKNEAQLIVRPSQVAVFIYEGQIADIYTPGKHTLTTDTMPVLTSLSNWKYKFNSPFKTDIYFISTAIHIDNKWGTQKPITMRDQDFGIVRLRGFGNFSFKVSESTTVIKNLLTSMTTVSVSAVTEQLRVTIISALTDYIVRSNIPAIDLPMEFDEINKNMVDALQPKFSQLGLELCSFAIENVSLPEEVEKAIDKRSSMGAIGDLDKYTKFQAADSIKDAAKNPSGMAGIGASMTVGMQMASAMGNTLNSGNNSNSNTTPSEKPSKLCPKCGEKNDVDSKFCNSCGQSLVNACIKCKMEIPPNSKFCKHCGASQVQERFCPKCNAKVDLDGKFCNDCGEKLV